MPVALVFLTGGEAWWSPGALSLSLNVLTDTEAGAAAKSLAEMIRRQVYHSRKWNSSSQISVDSPDRNAMGSLR